ncbi:hypothetical protein KP509_11G078100 [Ceratopteris richardii]|uniref:RecF/RecN/SMC N-terminal domain-containing protein n=1 Tax=Ceratopteris richardii TaxID=49495 RepID=A0A8T2TUK2_CERRI|nr:hypothetical protein KP509_11G078100 [Ceratopteris richardii]
MEKISHNCIDNDVSQVGPELLRVTLEEARTEKDHIVEVLETLQGQLEEAQSSNLIAVQKLSNLEIEDLEQSIESKVTELQCFQENLMKTESQMEHIAKEEEVKMKMIAHENEAINCTNKDIDQLKVEILGLQKELTQAKMKEDRINHELEELPNPPNEEDVEPANIRDMKCLAAEKCNLKKMLAELNQLHGEQHGISIAEQVAMKERADKLEVFKARRSSIVESIDILMKGIDKSKKKVQEANEAVFQKICQAFSEICSYLLPNKLVSLIKVGDYVEDGVRFAFSNQSSKMSANEWKTKLEELSGGQKTLLSLAFLLAVSIPGRSPLYLLDEIDAALDEENQNRVAKLIKNVISKDSQVICVSHHLTFQQQGDAIIQVTKVDGTTKLYQSLDS